MFSMYEMERAMTAFAPPPTPRWFEQQPGESAAHWYRRIAQNMCTTRAQVDAAAEAAHAEREKVRASLAADLAPDWLIEMVMERWADA